MTAPFYLAAREAPDGSLLVWPRRHATPEAAANWIARQPGPAHAWHVLARIATLQPGETAHA